VLTGLCNHLQDTLLHVLWSRMSCLQLHVLQTLPLLCMLQQSQALHTGTDREASSNMVKLPKQLQCCQVLAQVVTGI
jgi:hypothetical protein